MRLLLFFLLTIACVYSYTVTYNLGEYQCITVKAISNEKFTAYLLKGNATVDTCQNINECILSDYNVFKGKYTYYLFVDSPKDSPVGYVPDSDMCIPITKKGIYITIGVVSASLCCICITISAFYVSKYFAIRYLDRKTKYEDIFDKDMENIFDL